MYGRDGGVGSVSKKIRSGSERTQGLNVLVGTCIMEENLQTVRRSHSTQFSSLENQTGESEKDEVTIGVEGFTVTSSESLSSFLD